jgi:hypothetical protein
MGGSGSTLVADRTAQAARAAGTRMSTALADTPIYRRLRRESLTDSWLSARLGIDTGRLAAMRRAGDLIGVREPGGLAYLYPAWQFQNGKPRPLVPQLVRTAREAGLDDERLYEVMTMRLGLGGEQRLCDLLVAGQDEAVLAAVRSGARP